MSRETFAALTIPEFEKAFVHWRKVRELEERIPWEVMRTQVTLTLQPFVNKEIDPKRICPLPWDQGERPEKTEAEKKHQTERVKKYLATGHWD